jgi:hypothetical protein
VARVSWRMGDYPGSDGHGIWSVCAIMILFLLLAAPGASASISKVAAGGGLFVGRNIIEKAPHKPVLMIVPNVLFAEPCFSRGPEGVCVGDSPDYMETYAQRLAGGLNPWGVDSAGAFYGFSGHDGALELLSPGNVTIVPYRFKGCFGDLLVRRRIKATDNWSIRWREAKILHLVGDRIRLHLTSESGIAAATRQMEAIVLRSEVGSELAPLLVRGGNQLAKSDDGVGSHEQQRGSPNPVFPLAPIVLCFVAAGILIYFGMPESSLQGFFMTGGGVLVFCFGFYLMLALCLPL